MMAKKSIKHIFRRNVSPFVSVLLVSLLIMAAFPAANHWEQSMSELYDRINKSSSVIPISKNSNEQSPSIDPQNDDSSSEKSVDSPSPEPASRVSGRTSKPSALTPAPPPSTSSQNASTSQPPQQADDKPSSSLCLIVICL